jgi:GNAT superfamily N-acetyltransferase
MCSLQRMDDQIVSVRPSLCRVIPPPDLVAAIRRALPDDAAGMARAHARSWQATYTGLLPAAVINDVVASEPARAKRWRTRLAGPQLGGAFVAELNRRIVGFAFWAPSDEPAFGAAMAEIQAIYLVPEAVGLGIGRSLFQAAVDDIVAHQFEAAVLWVLDTNERARGFYEAAGWVADGATKTEERPSGALHELRFSRMFVVE